MKKIAIEIMRRAGDQVTVIIPDTLSRLEILGLANEVLVKLGLHEARIVIGPEDKK